MGIELYTGWEVVLFVLIIAVMAVVWFIAVVALSTFLAWAVGFIFGDDVADLKLLRTILIAIGFAAPMFILHGSD